VKKNTLRLKVLAFKLYSIKGTAVKKGVFKAWKKEILRTRYEHQKDPILMALKGDLVPLLRIHEEELRRRGRAAASREGELMRAHDARSKMRKEVVIRYFAERANTERGGFSGGRGLVGEVAFARRREGFDAWKEQFTHLQWVHREDRWRRKMDAWETAQSRRRDEELEQRAAHMSVRRDMLTKYFAEKVAPGVHDVAAKREALGVWKQEYSTPQNKRDLIPKFQILIINCTI
jgi:hypothetical protein